MTDSLYKGFAGKVSFGSADPVGDAEHVVHRYMPAVIPYTSIGAAAKKICLGIAQADLYVTNLIVTGSTAVTSAASDPELDLVYDDGAAGGFTSVGEFIDISATAIVANVAQEVSVANVLIPKGSYIYVFADVNGTPADMGEAGVLTCMFDYILKN